MTNKLYQQIVDLTILRNRYLKRANFDLEYGYLIDGLDKSICELKKIAEELEVYEKKLSLYTSKETDTRF